MFKLNETDFVLRILNITDWPDTKLTPTNFFLNYVGHIAELDYSVFLR
jgi:hypothetical protein